MKFSVLLLLYIAIPIFSMLPVNHFYPSREPVITIIDWGVKEGDSLQWAQRNLYNVNWNETVNQPLWRISEKDSSEIRWYRAEIGISEVIEPTKQLTLYLPVVISAFEVYWDGTLIGRSGDVDSGKSGYLSHYNTIPRNMTRPGQHTVALRVLNNTSVSGGVFAPVKLGLSAELLYQRSRSLSISYFLAGVLFITALFHLLVFTYPGGRKAPSILFSLFSLSCAGTVIVDSLVRYGGISIEAYFPLALVGDIFWFGMIILLPIFMLSHFQAFYRNLTGGLFALLTLIIIAIPRLALYGYAPSEWLPPLDLLNRIFGYLSVVVAMLIVFGATLKKREGSKTILIGLFLLFIGLILSTAFAVVNGWSLGFTLLNIFITFAVARQLTDQMREYHRAEIKAARLELELLKMHIQPHFLLNSLNSIIAWIEEEPKVAGKLVNSLSRELRFLMAFAGESQVPITEELKLCQAHLSVMNMRKEKNLQLEVTGASEEIMVPPLVLHTLIENGISHGFRNQDNGLFQVSCLRESKWTTVILSNNGSSKGRTESSGTGGKYIRSRLQELFGNDWTLTSNATDDGWEWTIRFKEER